MDRRILRLGRALRGAGAPVATPEIVDACRAALAVGIERRDDLRDALRATLVKRGEHRDLFDAHFERLFPAAIPTPAAPPRGRGAQPGGAGAEARRGPTGAAGRPGPAGGPPSGRGERPGSARDGGPRDDGDDGGNDSGDDGREDRGGERRRGEAGPSVAAERRRLLTKGFRERWSGAEEREAAAAMEELAARLATRLARRRRRARRGAVDLAGTLRANLVHGGVPFVLRRRTRVVGRRDLVLLADVSGSVRRAAALFLLILARLRDRFAGVRAFAYVDRPAELPAALAGLPTAQIAAALAAALPLDALSDHGEMLRRFNRDFPGAVSNRSVVVILGDARNNRFPAQEGELESIRRRCRRLIWIVPEPASLWGSGDAAIASYAPHCDQVLAAANPLALVAAAASVPAGGRRRDFTATPRRIRIY